MLGAARVLCALLVVLLPWWYGGVTAGAEALLLGATGLAAACCALARIGVDGRPAGPPRGGRRALLVFAGAAAALAVAGWTTVSLPRGMVEWLSPATLEWRAPEPAGAPAWVPLAPAPDAAWSAWLRALACVVLAWTAWQVTRRSAHALVVVGAIAASGTAVAAYALLGTLSGGALTLHTAAGHGARAHGPFVNPNHLATTCAMTLPVLIALWRWKWRDREGVVRKRPALQITLTGAILVVVAALLASLSRGGMLAAAVGGAVYWWAARPATLPPAGAPPAAPWRRGVPVVAVVVLFALAFGVGPMLDRFALIEQQGNTRAVGWAMAWAIGWDFPLFGAGLGTFAELSPAYQPAGAPGWWDAAHCDWLDWWAATGLAGVVPMALAVGGWVWAFGRVRSRALRSTRRQAVAAAGGALAAVSWHAVVDFPFQIGAIAATAAVLAGLALGLVDQPERQPDGSGA
ncbi:MAG: O-antigen ligase family protein [Planctomycetota bacterium]